jgi:hypothetical protein
MVDRGKIPGSVVLVGLVLLVLIGALLAVQITGPMGIEDRFTSALGLQHQDEGGDDQGGFFGFNLEGNILAYLAILALLIIVSVVAYRKGGM